MSQHELNNDHVQYLVSKYEKQLPRYTSYPTAPEWHDITPEEQKQIIDASLSEHRDLSLYFHIPFCENRCLFCGCNTIISRNKRLGDNYLQLLQKEVRSFSQYWQKNSQTQSQKIVKQIHFGGGTPTFLEENQLIILKKIIDDNFILSSEQSGLEFSVEIDPEPTSHAQIALLRSLGVNRISIGVQDFNEDILQKVNRPQSTAKIKSLIDISHRQKFKSINIDLIYGLPGQTMDTFQKTIDQTIELKPDRIALFSYAHVPWIKSHQRTLEKIGFLQGYEKFQLFLLAWEKFIKAGYQYIGLDHFALADDPLSQAQKQKKMHRNFQGYTTQGDLDLLSFGISSISSSSAGYWQNPRDMASYEAKANDLPFIAIRGLKTTAEDIRRRKIILEILCHGQYSESDAQQREIDIINPYIPYQEMLEDKLIQATTDGFQLTLYGQLFSRNLAALFDAYLSAKKEGQMIFSKSI